MTHYDMYWKSNKAWWYYEDDSNDEEHVILVFHDDAPTEAKESYQNYLRQKEEHRKMLEKIALIDDIIGDNPYCIAPNTEDLKVIAEHARKRIQKDKTK